LTTPAYQRERRRLAEALKALRVGAGLSGARLAEMLGWQQSKVSKIETRRQLPGEDDISAWAGATGASPEAASDLLAMLRGARIEYAAWKDAYRESGADGVQAGILEIEAGSARIAEFQPALISGLLQTAEYARELQHLPCGPLSYGRDEDEISRMVAERMQRQQVLYQPGKQVQIVMLEGALRSRVVSAQTLAGQLDRLMSVIGLASLELGIIPFEAAVPVWPTAGFRLYDDLVIEESVEGENQVADPDLVARYGKDFELLREAANVGRDAVPVIRRSLDSLGG
jgi:transcriptional regulator with XRE-family HTH domain